MCLAGRDGGSASLVNLHGLQHATSPLLAGTQNQPVNSNTLSLGATAASELSFPSPSNGTQRSAHPHPVSILVSHQPPGTPGKCLPPGCVPPRLGEQARPPIAPVGRPQPRVSSRVLPGLQTQRRPGPHASGSADSDPSPFAAGLSVGQPPLPTPVPRGPVSASALHPGIGSPPTPNQAPRLLLPRGDLVPRPALSEKPARAVDPECPARCPNHPPACPAVFWARPLPHCHSLSVRSGLPPFFIRSLSCFCL